MCQNRGAHTRSEGLGYKSEVCDQTTSRKQSEMNTNWRNNWRSRKHPNLIRAEYKQLCNNKVVSQLQNAKQSHALTSCNCLQACWNNCKLYTKSSWSKPVHLYYQPCTAVHLLATYSKLCSTFHQHASPSKGHL